MAYEGLSRRAQLIELLRASTIPRTIADLADELAVHVNTVRFHLDTLITDGRVDKVSAQAGGPGRPPSGYRLTVGMDRRGPTNYRLLATMLTSYLATSTSDPAQVARDLGRVWGPSLHDERREPLSAGAPSGALPRISKTKALTRMVGVLADLGFAPESPESSQALDLRLRHCPFLEVVGEHADVICSVHLGLMQGAFAAMNAPVTAERLTPFAEPDLCIAHLAPVAATGKQVPRQPNKRSG